MVHASICELLTWQKSGCLTNRFKPAVRSSQHAHMDGTQTGRVGIWRRSRLELPPLPRQDGAWTGSRTSSLRWGVAL